MPILKDVGVHLEHTLESGQLFRYFEDKGWWYVQNGDRVFKMREKGSDLEYEGNVDEDYMHTFLRLGDNLTDLSTRYAQEDFVSAFSQFSGLRITKQDPWECTISFICSANANIPKIKGNINYLAQKYGKKITMDGHTFYTFPKIGQLKNEEVLRDAKTGYRAKYIVKTNGILTKKMIKLIEDAPYEEAKQLIMTLPGVGEKVADCILLFGYGKMESFPVDTWMLKIMGRLYYKNNPPTPSKVAKFARGRFGNDAGYVQQYLFYMSRLGL